jgi:thiol-disulfide isomerase/thioredoxin
VKRRNMLYGGAAVAAGLAGAGVAWWTDRLKGGQGQATPNAGQVAAVVPAPASAPGDPDKGAREAAAAFWSLSFETPDGQTLPMSSFRGKRLLVNFWATWCPPCVDELPLLDYFYQENRDKNWQLLGLAVDQPGAVRDWLKNRPLNYPVGMAAQSGIALGKSLGNTEGSLPFSVLFDPQGELLQRKVGRVLAEDLGAWMRLK